MDHNGVLTFNEIIKLVTVLNIYMPKASIRAIFDKVDLDKSGQLDIDEFMDFVKLLRERYFISFIAVDNFIFYYDGDRIFGEDR